MATAAALVLGCATHHTVEPYRSDPVEAQKLEAKATRICEEMAPAASAPEQPFVTDGCSRFPDGGWVECCVEHDIPYWCGGTRDERRAADARFRQCVADADHPWLAPWMEWGVRVGGHPLVPAGWRWGFGHPYPAGYEEPSPQPEESEEAR